MPTKPSDKIVYQPQEIFNQSFDEDFKVLVFEELGFDGQSLLKRKAGDLSDRFDYDSNSNLIYLGQATTGAATSDTKWQIRKFAYDASDNLISIKYANGSPNFDQIWDNRVALTYA